ncbi:nucleotidyltransferase family protein [Novosphingopyxis sp.]|uniref:nucleotidyltransferase family protein n=1 Tax=Novosphingopyxis sp. TaxID=2709690 RepID=UPI003B5A9687
MVIVTGAMVMAAGLGKRMRPLTASSPKPLVRVAGQPLIDHTLAHLAKAGVRDVVVNVHYLADALEAHVANAPFGLNYQISDERERLLETGGGLVKALPMIASDPFFCVNSDNIWVDGPRAALTQLAEEWNGTRMDALLLLVPHARAHHHGGSGDFHLDGQGRISWRKERKVAPFIFTGIQLMAKRLIEGDAGESFGTSRFWDKAIADGRLYGSIFDGEWFDIGTPAAIRPTEAWFTNG